MIGGFLNNRMIINLSSLSNKSRFSSGKAVGGFSDVTNLIPHKTSKLVIQKICVIAIF